MNKTEKTNELGLLKTLSSIQFGIVLLVVIVVVSIVGTLIPQGQPLSFYHENFGPFVNLLITVFRFDITYGSPLFIGLLALFGINLTLCSIIRFPSILRNTFNPDTSPSETAILNMPVHTTVKNGSLETAAEAFAKHGMKLRTIDSGRLYGEKGRLGYLGSTLVHISLLVFLAGGFATFLTGQRGYLVLEKGQTLSTVEFPKGDAPLGFDITLREFNVEFYEDFPGRPKSYTSSVTVEIPGAEPIQTDIQVNHPLMLNGFTVFQSSYGTSEDASNVTSDQDTASVTVNLKGMPEDMSSIVTLDMVSGEIYPVPGFGDSMKVTLNELHRDFKRMGPGGGGANPAVRIDVVVNGEKKWSVFAFKNFPGMNMPMADDLPLLFNLDDIKIGPTVVSEFEPGYYTVLGVSTDSGIPLVWAGAIIMMIGLAFSFYIRPRRVWIFKTEDSDLSIGARTKGDSGPLRDWVQSTVKTMKDI